MSSVEWPAFLLNHPGHTLLPSHHSWWAQWALQDWYVARHHPTSSWSALQSTCCLLPGLPHLIPLGSEFCVPPKSVCWSPSPSAMASQAGAFAGWLGQAGGALMNGICVLAKRPREPLPLHPWGCRERKAASGEVGPHQTPSTLILNMPTSRTVGNKCLFFPGHGV